MKLFISENDIVFLKLNDDTPENYYYSKLCFFNETVCIQSRNIKINEGNGFYYNKETEEYYFPHDINEYQRCFLLRLIIDSIQLERGNLPMHTAVVSDGTEAIVISAESGMGKSFISDEICRLCKEYYTIGDDHIIISSEYIQGNKKRRVRNINIEECAYTENKGLSSFKELIFICYDFSENKNYTMSLSATDIFEYFKSKSAFKYLNETFVHNNISYRADKITDININEVYRKKLFHYLNGKNALYICGTQQYAVECIFKIIRGRS